MKWKRRAAQDFCSRPIGTRALLKQSVRAAKDVIPLGPPEPNGIGGV